MQQHILHALCRGTSLFYFFFVFCPEKVENDDQCFMNMEEPNDSGLSRFQRNFPLSPSSPGKKCF